MLSTEQFGILIFRPVHVTHFISLIRVSSVLSEDVYTSSQLHPRLLMDLKQFKYHVTDIFLHKFFFCTHLNL